MNCRIFVNELTGKTLSVYVDSEEELRNMTVKELKRRVCPDLPYHMCRLLYRDKELENDHTLRYYGVSNGCTMLMIICPPAGRGGGGGPPPDEDKGVPRTESMEKLADMQQEESSGSCCIMGRQSVAFRNSESFHETNGKYELHTYLTLIKAFL
ncbi:ubiquitin-ribosomal protein eL40 fusion protein-like isoform X2 [Chanodichthys erythropterus]|uniref:ubiquitin-ribosomal protein eL40 fusion protein-like isoform X2 n=1 Tax=Chanodichthys erythropterus TaxID=933992 RepID=UPI00351EB80A